MNLVIALTANAIASLDLSPASQIIEPLLEQENITSSYQQLSFNLDYPRSTSDPRELSEIPEVRLWFVRLDAHYPYLLFFINPNSGELYRYVAMLVPHQFSRAEGIQYNPEALELFVMQKIFVLSAWLKQKGISGTSRLKSLAQTLGYEIENSFFELL